MPEFDWIAPRLASKGLFKPQSDCSDFCANKQQNIAKGKKGCLLSPKVMSQVGQNSVSES